MARKIGRPTTYKKKYIKEVDKYIATCKDDEYEFHNLRGEKMDGYKESIRAEFPTFEGFSEYLKIPLSTIEGWWVQFPEFKEACTRIQRVQKDRLMKMGASGKYNPLITKLILSANHGMKEKTDITTDGKPLPQPILAPILIANENKSLPNQNPVKYIEDVPSHYRHPEDNGAKEKN